ncbi:MAG TPA: hypothetical protein ENH59_10845 [Bacteroidetes bacterium]|nr:hypothetical protein [Bacteroidota bacterium]
MVGFNVNIIILIIIILLIIVDLLSSLEFMNTDKMILAGTLSYISNLAFFMCFIFTPEKTFVLVSIIAIGLIPNSYYWYNRTTKGKKKRQAVIISILILAGITYYLGKII